VTADGSAGPFAATAVSTLIADGRAAPGSTIRLASADAVSALPALITPPADQVRLGAANRELERLGIPRRFGALQRRAVVARGGRLDNVAVTERYQLVRAVVVNAPPEESVLERWVATALAARLGGPLAHSASSNVGWVSDTYAAGATRPAGTPLLVLAVLLLAAEALA